MTVTEPIKDITTINNNVYGLSEGFLYEWTPFERGVECDGVAKVYEASGVKGLCDLAASGGHFALYLEEEGKIGAVEDTPHPRIMGKSKEEKKLMGGMKERFLDGRMRRIHAMSKGNLSANAEPDENLTSGQNYFLNLNKKIESLKNYNRAKRSLSGDAGWLVSTKTSGTAGVTAHNEAGDVPLKENEETIPQEQMAIANTSGREIKDEISEVHSSCAFEIANAGSDVVNVKGESVGKCGEEKKVVTLKNDYGRLKQIDMRSFPGVMKPEDKTTCSEKLSLKAVLLKEKAIPQLNTTFKDTTGLYVSPKLNMQDYKTKPLNLSKNEGNKNKTKETASKKGDDDVLGKSSQIEQLHINNAEQHADSEIKDNQETALVSSHYVNMNTVCLHYAKQSESPSLNFGESESHHKARKLSISNSSQQSVKDNLREDLASKERRGSSLHVAELLQEEVEDIHKSVVENDAAGESSKEVACKAAESCEHTAGYSAFNTKDESYPKDRSDKTRANKTAARIEEAGSNSSSRRIKLNEEKPQENETLPALEKRAKESPLHRHNPSKKPIRFDRDAFVQSFSNCFLKYCDLMMGEEKNCSAGPKHFYSSRTMNTQSENYSVGVDSKETARGGSSDYWKKGEPGKQLQRSVFGKKATRRRTAVDFVEANKQFVREVSEINREMNSAYNCLQKSPRATVTKSELLLQLAKNYSYGGRAGNMSTREVACRLIEERMLSSRLGARTPQI